MFNDPMDLDILHKRINRMLRGENMKSLEQIHRDEGVTPEQAEDAARPMTEAEINAAVDQEEKKSD